MTDLLNITISLLPVVAFLVALVFMDSFKLVTARSVGVVIFIGGCVALASFLLNVAVAETTDVSYATLRRFVAPGIEEILKSLWLVYLIRSRRIGFMVDAAIYGFSLGTGFALIENIYYLQEYSGAGLVLWIIRGLGTALMHGSTMAIFAMISKSLTDRFESTGAIHFVPGLLGAVLIHSFYNNAFIHPLLTTAIIIGTLPMGVIAVFNRSEKATREWMGISFDTDMELLEQILRGEIQQTRIGHYLESLRSRFPAVVVGDLLCFLQIHLELSVRAKGILMAREAGIPVEVDDATRANLEELKYLEKSVGPTGMLAVHPFLNMTSRDLWQLYMLGK